MPREFARSERVAQLISRELSLILRNEVKDPRVNGLTITDVEVTKDMRQAKIFVSSMLDDQIDPANIVQALDKASGFIRRHLANNLDLRHCPQLVFAYDNSIAYSEKMSGLIDKALGDKELD